MKFPLKYKAALLILFTLCGLARSVFKHSPVFRIGGDEFVTILEEQGYNKQEMTDDILKAKNHWRIYQQDVCGV